MQYPALHSVVKGIFQPFKGCRTGCQKNSSPGLISYMSNGMTKRCEELRKSSFALRPA